jgi:hypothetical protein
MNNNLKILIALVAIIIFGTFVYYYKTKPTSINQGTPIVTGDSIKGCYVGRLAKDVYTLTILSQNGESFGGKLSFKNFEKDSSTGTYTGTYKNGILLGDYSFSSEGINSVMQVVFKKSGNGFVRGYGDLIKDGTRFVDLNNIRYDVSYKFEASTDCAGDSSVLYKNADYGFTFSLPQSWKGYVFYPIPWNHFVNNCTGTRSEIPRWSLS